MCLDFSSAGPLFCTVLQTERDCYVALAQRIGHCFLTSKNDFMPLRDSIFSYRLRLRQIACV